MLRVSANPIFWCTSRICTRHPRHCIIVVVPSSNSRRGITNWWKDAWYRATEEAKAELEREEKMPKIMSQEDVGDSTSTQQNQHALQPHKDTTSLDEQKQAELDAELQEVSTRNCPCTTSCCALRECILKPLKSIRWKDCCFPLL